jgi:hypothetical protein
MSSTPATRRRVHSESPSALADGGLLSAGRRQSELNVQGGRWADLNVQGWPLALWGVSEPPHKEVVTPELIFFSWPTKESEGTDRQGLRCWGAEVGLRTGSKAGA